ARRRFVTTLKARDEARRSSTRLKTSWFSHRPYIKETASCPCMFVFIPGCMQKSTWAYENRKGCILFVDHPGEYVRIEVAINDFHKTYSICVDYVYPLLYTAHAYQSVYFK